MQQQGVRQVSKLLVVQLALTLILTVAALSSGKLVALSVLIGAGACLLASSIFAFWVFRSYRAQDPGALVVRFYGAEIIKLSVVLGLFAIAFTTIEDLNVPALLMAYFAAQVLPATIAFRWDARKTHER